MTRPADPTLYLDGYGELDITPKEGEQFVVEARLGRLTALEALRLALRLATMGMEAKVSLEGCKGNKEGNRKQV